MPRLVCNSCGYADEYARTIEDAVTGSSNGGNCPRCGCVMVIQTERFNIPSNGAHLTDAEDLDKGDPYLWDKPTQELADADD